MTLMLHCGAKEVDYDGLRQLDVPAATPTHVPIPHFRVVDMLKHTLSFYGHEISDEHYGLTEDGMRFFGLLELKSAYGEYTDTVCLRNSHDKSFPVGIGFGSKVFVCDNLAFTADHVINRKHTPGLKKDLPGLVGELIEPLALQRQAQATTISLYQRTQLTDEHADHAILSMYREGIINLTRIADVVSEWDKPTFEAFNQRNAWRLFNAATFALAGRVVENPNSTSRLHQIIDGVCSTVH